MDIKIISEVVNDYTLIRTAGRLVDEHDLVDHAKLVYGEIIKYDKKKILLDNAGILFPTDLFQYYSLVQFYINNFPADIRSLKVACVVAPNFIKQGKFWETASANQGFDYVVFTSLAEATKWLE